MSNESSGQQLHGNPFWSNATRYASSCKNDENFVNEIAYVMVTLHRTGA